ncbi:hypothetical protein BJX99DRAFT_261714 [Aspergillus californicus]
MKSFTAISAVFAAASMASAQTPSVHVLRLSPLSVKTLTESATARIDFGVEDLIDGSSTTCSTAWNIGALDATTWFQCEDTSFTFNFPTGMPDVEDFTFLIGHSAPTPVGSVITQAILNSHAGTPIYVCHSPGATAGTATQCDVNENSGVIAAPVNQ